MTQSSLFEDALKIITSALPFDEVNWAVTGRASLFLQGADIEARDIDLLTTSKCAYEIERRLRTYTIKHVQYIEDIGSSSHFGMLSINGIHCEIIGAYQEKTQDGWNDPTEVLDNRHFVEYAGITVPVTTLKYETYYLKSIGDVEGSAVAEAILHREAGV